MQDSTVKQVYKLRRDFILIGLTERQVADALRSQNFSVQRNLAT